MGNNGNGSDGQTGIAFNKSSLFAGIVDKSSGKEMQCTMCIGWFEEWRNEGMNNMIQRMVRLGDFMYI